ncbi:leucyl aminopeptidase [Polycladidibacter stylochi]|uniref:leucyl aminopeptidase n=1 Tax=Polycladidibacter stylochi TaxID=1807766 RepID=UPI000835865B|nr:leucyl aminopeptidase [Pseudovibrio stylochi]
MAKLPNITFIKAGSTTSETLVLPVAKNLELSSTVAEVVSNCEKTIKTAADISKFTGKKSTFLNLLTPAGTELERLLLVGLGERQKLEESDLVYLGGDICGKLLALKAKSAHILSDFTSEEAALLAEGALLRAYKFDQFLTKKDEEEDADIQLNLSFIVSDVAQAEAAWQQRKAVAEGVLLAREVVNLPPNYLGPVEFAQKAQELSKVGIETEVLDEEQMQALGMGALLGVGQGSERPSRLAIMKWNGGKQDEAPVAFVGKGVVFDSGGISLKPGAGMDEMKGDMGGAGAVIGLMHAVASRKANLNIIGVLGLVENMPDGKAQRPGDIVTTMSGQTIEILNTDAEGRLVLADALWYTNDRFKPQFIVDLATLTGACMVALGNHHAGLFSNDDDLAAQITQSGQKTAEKVWRLPLGKEYDKMIDTPNADMKNTGGSRMAGATTAAQLLQRFVGETKWAHIDVAGTAMGSTKTSISKGWASGFGVRLLDRFLADFYEK